MVDRAEIESKQIAEDLKTNYKGMTIKKSVLRIKYRLAWSYATLIFQYLNADSAFIVRHNEIEIKLN